MSRSLPVTTVGATVVAPVARAARIAVQFLLRARGSDGSRPSAPLDHVTPASAGSDGAGQDCALIRLCELLDELLDAHADTVRLAEPLAHDVEWTAHVDYLRALQRNGRTVLAHTTTEVPA